MELNTFKTYLESRIIKLSNQYQEYKMEEGKATDETRRSMMNACASQIFEAKSEAELILKAYREFEIVHKMDILQPQQHMMGRLLSVYDHDSDADILLQLQKEQSRLERETLGLSMNLIVEPEDVSYNAQIGRED